MVLLSSSSWSSAAFASASDAAFSASWTVSRVSSVLTPQNPRVMILVMASSGARTVLQRMWFFWRRRSTFASRLSRLSLARCSRRVRGCRGGSGGWAYEDAGGAGGMTGGRPEGRGVPAEEAARVWGWGALTGGTVFSVPAEGFRFGGVWLCRGFRCLFRLAGRLVFGCFRRGHLVQLCQELPRLFCILLFFPRGFGADALDVDVEFPLAGRAVQFFSAQNDNLAFRAENRPFSSGIAVIGSIISDFSGFGKSMAAPSANRP